MANLEDDESDNLILPPEEVAEFAWDEFNNVCIEEPPEPKKVGRIKAIFEYIRSKYPPEKEEQE